MIIGIKSCHRVLKSSFCFLLSLSFLGVLGALAVYAEPPFYPDKSKLLVVRDAEGKEQPVRTAADWAKRREHMLANRDCITAAKPVYELLDAKDKLAANYPDCKHDFPPDVRKVAYEWLDHWLK